mmetsp:Transcript_11914/g.35520  ORF Transcript_11914/g.35520 Transcript_11914/m.35520 type:complete len:332 (+) Transcript_11914:55-1050(+)
MASFKENVDRKKDIVVAAAKKAPPSIGPYLEKAAPALATAGAALDAAAPYAAKAGGYCVSAYEFLEPYHPEDLACVVFGFFMCFFGGEFPALITAVEAYRQIGYEPTLKALKVLYADWKKVRAKFAEDDKIDSDKDGVPDVAALPTNDLLERKALLFLRTADPETASEAIQAISAGYVAVLAALKVAFAQAIVVGGAIGDVLRPQVLRHGQPLLKKALNEDYHKWIAPGLTYLVKAITISIAWTIQRVMSAFHSAVRGGQLAGKGVVSYLYTYGYISVDHDETYADEVAGYTLAFLGLAFQIKCGFSIPFPLSLLFLPCKIIEAFIVWTIM